MTHHIIELATCDGDPILVSVNTPESYVQRVSKDGDTPIQRVDQTFEAVKDLVLKGCRPLCSAFQTLNQDFKAKEAEVEFGISFTAQGSVYVVSSSAEATMKVKVTWDFSEQP